jgi:steroid delta-isomerase-like uncharacterized protein
MSVEESQTILRGIIDAINTGSFSAFDDLVAEDFQEHLNVFGAAPGREGYRQMMQGMRAAFPDFTVMHEFMLCGDDMISSRFVASGTHRGDFAGIPPAGKQITVQGIEIFRFENGKLAERWGEVDQLGMLIQLGAIPAPGGA